MRLCQGKTGSQETVSLAAIAVAASAIFTIDSPEMYSAGNSSYVSVPVGILLSLGAFCAVSAAMRKSGSADLFELTDGALGKAFGTAAAFILGAMAVANAYFLLERFVSLIHSFVFVSSDYSGILVWILPVTAYIAIRGLECIGRLAKIFGGALLVLMLIGIISVAKGYSPDRLEPIIGNGLGDAALQCVRMTSRALPALLILLGLQRGFHGNAFAGKNGARGALIAAAFSCAVQLCIGMAYSYTELSGLFMPLYRLNMVVIRESYWFRLDKLGIFIWLVGAMVAAAYYIYAAAYIFTVRWGRLDTRPSAVSISLVIGCSMMLGHMKWHEAMHAAALAIKGWGGLCGAPFIAAAAVAAVKQRRKRNESKSA